MTQHNLRRDTSKLEAARRDLSDPPASLSDSRRGFVECTACHVWAYIPDGFRETRHFAKCPQCHNPMYLLRNALPSEGGLRDANRVVANLMENGL